MAQLVALDLPGSPRFVDALQRVWDAGDVAFPLDQRLPDALKAALCSRFSVGRIIGPQGIARLDEGRACEPGDALVVATSGTTGEPKGAVLTHAAVQASATVTNSYLQADPQRDRYLACLPLAHIGGLAVVTRALHGGVPLTVLDGFDAQAVTEAASQGATLTSLVVTALGRIDPAVFRTILLGGSAIPVDRPPNSVATYGMTETGSGVVYDGWPLPGVELRIEDGEVQVRSATMLRAYRDGSDPRTADGWLPTGDGGRILDTGRLEVFGRRGDMITTGGEKVWPARVEAAITRLPGVREAVIVGRPDSEWGQRVTCVLIPQDPASPPDLDELRHQLADRLAAYELPKALEVVSALPRTASSKVRRDEL